MTAPDAEPPGPSSTPPAPAEPPVRASSVRHWAMLAELLHQHLDPGYAEAARRRRADPAPSAGRRRGLSALTAVTAAVVGVILAVAYQQTQSQASQTARTRAALVERVNERSAATDRLQRDVDALRAEVAEEQQDALADSAAGQTVARQLRDLETVTGLAPVRGPGIVARLADGPPSDPSAPGDVDLGKVQDRDLQDVVNALWRAGAEAVAIDGQRLAATSTIRAAGGAVLVDFRPVDSPYTLEAIGDDEALHRRFLSSDAVRRVRGLVQEYGMRFTVRRVDELSLPAGGPPQLRGAEPLPSQAATGPARTPATREPSPGSSAPRPTPRTPGPTASRSGGGR